MKKLSEYQNEDALELMADLIEPAVEVFSDKAIADAWNKGKRARAVSVAIKNHKSEVLQMLATLEGVPVREYKCNLATLPGIILNILNDAELLAFFKSQGQSAGLISSGSAMENTDAAQGTSSDI